MKMNIKPINLRVAFDKTGIMIDHPKHTFSQKAKNAVSPTAKKYYKSLNSEAKARLEYMKYQKADEKLSNIPEEFAIGNILSGLKTLSKMVNHKVKSVIYQTDSYRRFPERFWEADNQHAYPERFYKLSSSYKMPWE